MVQQIHKRKIKLIEFSLGNDPADIAFECQISAWTLNNNTEDGDKLYTLCPTGEDTDEVDPDYTIDLTAFSDWRSDGFSDYLWAHDGETVNFVLVHHPDIPAEKVTWSGSVKIKAPSVGGEARDNEVTEVTLVCIGKPVYSRADAES
jgi:hypothetical protein